MVDFPEEGGNLREEFLMTRRIYKMLAMGYSLLIAGSSLAHGERGENVWCVPGCEFNKFQSAPRWCLLWKNKNSLCRRDGKNNIKCKKSNTLTSIERKEIKESVPDYLFVHYEQKSIVEDLNRWRAMITTSHRSAADELINSRREALSRLASEFWIPTESMHSSPFRQEEVLGGSYACKRTSPELGVCVLDIDKLIPTTDSAVCLLVSASKTPLNCRPGCTADNPVSEEPNALRIDEVKSQRIARWCQKIDQPGYFCIRDPSIKGNLTCHSNFKSTLARSSFVRCQSVSRP
jgi:hypothetical protein